MGNIFLQVDEFVSSFIGKMLPNPDLGAWETLDLSKKQSYFENVYGFARNCEKVDSSSTQFLSLRLLVLYHWLDCERKCGLWSWERFNEFISIPRSDVGSECNNVWIERMRKDGKHVFGQFNGPQWTILNWPNNSEIVSLIRAFVERYYEMHTGESDGSAFNQFLSDGLVRSILATTRLLGGH